MYIHDEQITHLLSVMEGGRGMCITHCHPPPSQHTHSPLTVTLTLPQHTLSTHHCHSPPHNIHTLPLTTHSPHSTVTLHPHNTHSPLTAVTNTLHSPLSGMVRRAAMALMADRFSSSCFSYSCLTEFAFAFSCTVDRRGSISLSMPEGKRRQEYATKSHMLKC